MSVASKEEYEFADFRLEVTERLLLLKGDPVRLPEKAFETLCVLVRQNGHLVGKDELIAEVWPDTIVEENNLDKNISLLRQVLGGKRKGKESFIETVRGHGYRFVADVKQLEAKENGRGSNDAGRFTDTITGNARRSARARRTEGSNTVVALDDWRPEPEDRPLSGELLVGDLVKRRTVWKIYLTATAGLIIVVLLFIGSWVILRPPATPGSSDSPIKSIAVLPFRNESGNPDVDYLAEGVPESLINRLSQLPGMKVIARSSTFKYKDKNADLQDVANALGVEAILSGRVSQRGENILINVELVDARNKTQLWGEQYNRRATDLLNVQSEISREIAERLRLRLTAVEQTQFARRETANAQAYELLLKGRFYWHKGRTENRKRAIEYFQKAIEADHDYALAYAESSAGYYDLIANSILDPKDFMPKAEAAARKALELDDSLAEAHLALARINLVAWDWAAAERECERAIELSPNLAEAHIQYSYYLTFMARHEQAIAEAKRAKELDPVSPYTISNVGFQQLLARQNDHAIEAAKESLELDQGYPHAHTLIAYACAAKGQYPEAIAAYQKAVALGDYSPDTQIYLAAAYALAGERRKAQPILKKLESGERYVSPGALADLYAVLGEREKAFAALERAYAAHDAQLNFLAVDPNLDPLRDDPRFDGLLNRVGLPQ